MIDKEHFPNNPEVEYKLDKFKYRIQNAFEEGILLLAKYGLILLAFTFTYTYIINLQNAAINGQQAAIAIREMQEKGWLPKFPIPQREDGKVSDFNPAVKQ